MGVQEIAELERSSLAIEVAARLRDLMARGGLVPGTRLIEAEVAQRLGISRGPLREALRILETEGLVRSHPGRGAFVAEISARDVQEIYSLRTILEEEALRLAIQKATPDDIAELERILSSMFAAAEQGNTLEVLDRDLEFHVRFWKIADHQRLEGFLREIGAQAKMYIAVQTALYDDLAAGISDHRSILDALKDSDVERATAVLREHLRVASETLLDYSRRQTDRP